MLASRASCPNVRCAARTHVAIHWHQSGSTYRAGRAVQSASEALKRPTTADANADVYSLTGTSLSSLAKPRTVLPKSRVAL
jgi:hypothetical protein